MSILTIELSPDGRLGQIYGKYNEEPSDEEMRFVQEWAEAKHLSLPQAEDVWGDGGWE